MNGWTNDCLVTVSYTERIILDNIDNENIIQTFPKYENA